VKNIKGKAGYKMHPALLTCSSKT